MKWLTPQAFFSGKIRLNRQMGMCKENFIFCVLVLEAGGADSRRLSFCRHATGLTRVWGQLDASVLTPENVIMGSSLWSVYSFIYSFRSRPAGVRVLCRRGFPVVALDLH